MADGNTQKFGVDYDKVFSAVVKCQTIRLVLILAAQRDYNLSSIDITQAYLQAELKEDLYMRVPPGIRAFDSDGKPLVCKLNRSLYGLKQAGREWAVLFSSFLFLPLFYFLDFFAADFATAAEPEAVDGLWLRFAAARERNTISAYFAMALAFLRMPPASPCRL